MKKHDDVIFDVDQRLVKPVTHQVYSSSRCQIRVVNLNCAPYRPWYNDYVKVADKFLDQVAGLDKTGVRKQDIMLGKMIPLGTYALSKNIHPANYSSTSSVPVIPAYATEFRELLEQVDPPLVCLLYTSPSPRDA